MKKGKGNAGSGWAFLALAALTMGTAGCAVQNPSPELQAKMAKVVYPKDAPLGADYDIVVTQKGSDIKLNNRTPQDYTNVQLWLNQQYVRNIGEIRIGNTAGTNLFELDKFYSAHAESFPVNSFLAPDRGRMVVLAEIFDPVTGQRHRLLVQPKD